jgi:hypothetical protein
LDTFGIHGEKELKEVDMSLEMERLR